MNWKIASPCLIWAETLHNPRLDACHSRRFRRHTSPQKHRHSKRHCHQQPLSPSPHTNRGQHSYSKKAVGAVGKMQGKGVKRGAITLKMANSGRKLLSKSQCGIPPGWPERLPTSNLETMSAGRTSGPASRTAPANPTVWKQKQR